MNTAPHTDHTTAQLASGFALGTLLGLTPLLNLHNLVALTVPVVFHVSFRSFLVGWLVTIPLGFLLDPVFDAIGGALLSSPLLEPMWVWATNTPVIPLTGFNNTVTLGSLVVWAVAAVPLYFLGRLGASVYRGRLDALFARVPLVSSLAQLRIVRRFLGLDYPRTGLVRKGFVIPFVTLAVLVSGAWWLLADRGARLAVVSGGEEIMGARVDVREADIDLSEGRFSFGGLEITDPRKPSQNLVEVGAMVADINTTPLLEAKIAIDSVVLRDVRFNTLRSSPGWVDTTRERGIFFQQQVERWRAATRIPTIPNPDFSSVINLGALDADSLQAVVRARRLGAEVDSARTSFGTRLVGVEPASRIDSVRSLLAALDGATVRSLGPAGATRAAASLRTAIEDLESTVADLNGLQSDFRGEAARLRAGLAELDQLKAGDFRRALGALNLPSLNPDDISASLLQGALMDRVESLTYWLALVDRYLPNGSEPFRIPGPRRLRGSGRRFVFPDLEELPLFAVNKVETAVVIGDLTGFTARLFDLNSDQRSVGRPTIFQLLGENGTSRATVEAVIDRLGEQAADEIRAELIMLPLPSFDLGPLGARLVLGLGDTRAAISRNGDSLSGVVRWTAREVSWEPLEGREPAAGATALVWRVVSSLRDVDVQLRLSGTVTSPRVAVSSSIGRQAAGALREQLGQELRGAEARVRAEVDRLVAAPVGAVTSSLNTMEEGVNRTVAENLRELETLKASLERRLRQLLPTVPGIGG